MQKQLAFFDRSCCRLKACLNDPTFHPTFQPTNFANVERSVQMTQHFIQHFIKYFYGVTDLNTLWRSCAFETGNHDQNANSARFFKQERMCNTNNVDWGVQTIQHFTQHQCWVNVEWNVVSLKQAFTLSLLIRHFLRVRFRKGRKSYPKRMNLFL